MHRSRCENYRRRSARDKSEEDICALLAVAWLAGGDADKVAHTLMIHAAQKQANSPTEKIVAQSIRQNRMVSQTKSFEKTAQRTLPGGDLGKLHRGIAKVG